MALLFRAKRKCLENLEKVPPFREPRTTKVINFCPLPKDFLSESALLQLLTLTFLKLFCFRNEGNLKSPENMSHLTYFLIFSENPVKLLYVSNFLSQPKFQKPPII